MSHEITDSPQDPQQDERYDLVIVGAGSGNSIVDERFGDQRVLLVDDGEHFGGTCLNAGCIPTKMLVHVADVAAETRDGAALGIRASVDAVDWPAISARVFGRIDAISEGGRELRESGMGNVTLRRESVGFEAPGVLVSASGQRITADRIVLAAGSRPRPLQAVYAPDPDIHDSDSIMRIAQLPASLLIVGGGYVAAEFAHVFSHLGVHVTQVARSAHLLGNLDADVSTRFTTLARTQWDVITGCEVEEIERDGDVLRSRLASGHLVETEAVLVALGRVPNTDTLAVANAGYDLHEDGRIVVDDRQRVLAGGEPVPGVFALGDISADHQLKQRQPPRQRRAAQPPAPGRPDRRGARARAAGGLLAPADRLLPAHGGGGPRGRTRRHDRAALLVHRVGLGAGGHDVVLQARGGSARRRHHPRRAHHRLGLGGADPAAPHGRQPRPPGDGPRPGAVLAAPGGDGDRRERAARRRVRGGRLGTGEWPGRRARGGRSILTRRPPRTHGSRE